MNLRGSFLTFLTVATMIVSPLAYAATTSTVMPFPTPTITNPCNGEDVNVSGNVHVTIGVTIDGNGGSHLRIHINNQDVSGIGVDTGSRYQIPTTSASSAYFGSATTMTLTVNPRVVAQGSTPNFNMRELIHVTVNANGVTTASIDNPSMDCNCPWYHGRRTRGRMPTYRSDVVGSLLRPAYLVEARRDLEGGRLTPTAFKGLEDRAVDEAIELQETAGLAVVTDGEMRRYAFFGHLIEALGGFDKLGGWASAFRNEQGALLDPSIREGYRQRGSDPERLIDTCIEMDNAVIGDHPGITFGLHICRGNNQSMFYASGGYEPIAERVFRRTRFQRFLLEYDDERSGSFEPLRAVPDDRIVVLGLVTTKKARLETVEELGERIEAAAKIVPRERLALSPQCGFASTLEGNRIAPEAQQKKLHVVAATARAVWGG